MIHKIVKINSIKGNPDNPRIIKDDKFQKLVESIKGFKKMLDIRPIVVNADMMIIGGNMRWKAAEAAGMQKIPIIIADDLSPDEQKEFTIRDNVAGGEWDWESLANNWDAASLKEWGMPINWEMQKDVVTNTNDGLHVNDMAYDYVTGEIKKFEFYIDHEDYDAFVEKLNQIKNDFDVENNSDALKALVMAYKK